MQVLVGTRDAAAILDVSVAAIGKMRASGRLRAVKSAPYMYAMQDIEAMKALRAGRTFGRRSSVEFVHGGEK